MWAPPTCHALAQGCWEENTQTPSMSTDQDEPDICPAGYRCLRMVSLFLCPAPVHCFGFPLESLNLVIMALLWWIIAITFHPVLFSIRHRAAKGFPFITCLMFRTTLVFSSLIYKTRFERAGDLPKIMLLVSGGSGVSLSARPCSLLPRIHPGLLKLQIVILSGSWNQFGRSWMNLYFFGEKWNRIGNNT